MKSIKRFCMAPWKHLGIVSLVSLTVFTAIVSGTATNITAAVTPPDTGSHPVYVINDALSPHNPLSLPDIGLIDIVQPDSALAHYGTTQVIRVYTKEFIKAHPERFGDVPVIKPDTVLSPGQH